MRYVNRLIAGSLALLMAMLVLCGTYGYFCSFVPSQLMVTITVWSASVLGLVSAAFYGGLGAFGWHPGQQAELSASSSQKRVKLPENRYLRALFMGAGVFGLTWLSLGAGPPLLLTMAVGHSGQIEAVVDGWTLSTGRSCLHPTLLHVPPLLMNERTLCTGARVKAGLPPGTRIRIFGKVSSLGVIPDAIQQSPIEAERKN